MSPLRWIAAYLPMLILAAPLSAAAFTIDLEVEFDTGMSGSFGTVEVTENAGDLDFVVTLDPALGPDADLHILYFNLTTEADLSISMTNAPTTEYLVAANPSVAGGAGSNFDYSVHFGSGAGDRGNGVLQLATFRITATEPLTLASLNESSFASGGDIEIHLAAHVQGTSLIPGASSETVGGFAPVPEPTTASLLATGLVGMLVSRSRRRAGRA